MRWERLFEDVESEFDAQRESERRADERERVRERAASLTLADRIAACARSEREVAIDLVDGTVLRGRVRAHGAGWLLLGQGEYHRVLVPLAALVSLATPDGPGPIDSDPINPDRVDPLAGRMTLPFVLRALARRRTAVSVGTGVHAGITGTLAAVGSDHLEIALHELGEPPRQAQLRGHRVVALATVTRIELDAEGADGIG